MSNPPNIRTSLILIHGKKNVTTSVASQNKNLNG
jgi:hypothetical protein